MFTGLVFHSGTIESFERRTNGARLRIRTSDVEAFERGESVAVNGVCLTVVPDESGSLFADVSEETLSRTTLGSLSDGTTVNIERALRLSDRVGGHLVQGHVDTIGRLVSMTTEGDFAIYRWSHPLEYAGLLVPKGSIAVDGVSLTVIDPDAGSEVATFGAALVPETLRRTILGMARTGDRANLEFDMIAKYVRALVAPYVASNSSQ